MRFFDIFMNSVSAFLLLCIAFDRYFKVCKPLKRMSRQKLKIAIISAFVVPAVCVWPMAIFHGPEKRATKFEGIYGMDCADDDQYSGTFIKKAFFLFVMLTILCSIVILVVLYSFIFHAILRWKREAIGESIIVRTDSKQNRKWNQSKSSLDVVHTNSIDTRELGERKSDQFLRSEKVIDIEVRSPNTSCNKRNNNMELKDVAENNQIFEKHKVRILVKSHRIQDSNHSKTSVFGRDDSNINGNNHNGHSASLKNKVTMKCDQNNKSVLQRVGSNTSKRRNTNRSTVMFSVVSLLYILSFLPTVVMEAANAFGAVYEANLSVTVKQLVVVANVSYFLNGSLNPIVYFVFNKSYRDEIYKMIMFR
ncbi:hypothetical protein FSP39_013234 [Pinctada imbricata]|uniref:G-protein coupled receptors family 1 profile domain-containing protein n=1 Tax=Pinctada imbricata TaxID=66713 RepID=A0AA88YAR2_PINIB|nr:hypothetical protein FSP39_013234 [Pinctada imbricata]